MCKNWSAKYQQDNKERLQKTIREIYKSLSKEEWQKNNMVVKIFQKSFRRWKTKAGWVQKKYYKIKRTPYYNYKKLF